MPFVTGVYLHNCVDHNYLSTTIQPIPYPMSVPCSKSTSLHFQDKERKAGLEARVQDIPVGPSSIKTTYRAGPGPFRMQVIDRHIYRQGLTALG